MSEQVTRIETGEDPKQVRDMIQSVFRDIHTMFRQKGEKLSGEMTEKLVTEGAPKKPFFPIFMVGLAVLKDLIDIPADLSIILIPLATFLSIACSIILFFWTLNKLSGGWWKKAMIRWVWVRYGVGVILELTPFVNMIPATTIFVLMAHYRETKIVKLLNAAMERLHRSGAIDYLK